MGKIAAIQMTTTASVIENLKQVDFLLKQAKEKGAVIAVLPEMFALFDVSDEQLLQQKEILGEGTIQHFLSQMAKQYALWIVGGTIPMATADPTKIAAACLIFDATGTRIARYDKMHLFDVALNETEKYHESDRVLAGHEVCVFDTPLGRMGIAVCYDIRFPGLFQAMLAKGAEIFAIPAAFTVTTGEAHWHVLLRARAIENGCYVIAAAQVGTHARGRQTYGHSVLIDPWGTIDAEIETKNGVIVTDIDAARIVTIRQKMPMQKHAQGKYC